MKSNSNIKPEKVIALWGRANSGKTETLRIVIDNLLQTGGQILKGTVPTDPTTDALVKLSWNGKIIGIGTEGDSRVILENSYNYLGADCDVYIFATRSRGGTVDFITGTFNNSLILWHTKWHIEAKNKVFASFVPVCDAVNKLQADEIVKMILLP